MENINANQAWIAKARKCADVCTTNAGVCKEEGLTECERLCTECAAACSRALAEAGTNAMLFEKCADACKACAAECDKHDHQHCKHCAEICRQCEEECDSMAV